MRFEEEEKKKVPLPILGERIKMRGSRDSLTSRAWLIWFVEVVVSTECLLDGQNCPKWSTRSYLSRSGLLHCVTRHILHPIEA
jgi:hypothetical protein